jgi:hypothetical protein
LVGFEALFFGRQSSDVRKGGYFLLHISIQVFTNSFFTGDCGFRP